MILSEKSATFRDHAVDGNIRPSDMRIGGSASARTRLTARSRLPSRRHFGKDKDLARVNAVWISDLCVVRSEYQCVALARAVGRTADPPQTVAARDDRGSNLGHAREG